MTALTTPALHHRLLLTVAEAVANDRLEETTRRGVGVVHELRESVARMTQQLEGDLAAGVEARSFARSHGALLPVTEENLAQLERLLQQVSPAAAGATAESLAAELRLLQQQTQAFRDRLAAALDLASRPTPAVDWQRLRQEVEADFAAGRFTAFATPDELVNGLAAGT
jgi:hypothetical protein